MTQRFKTVYYADHPASSPERKNVKIAFGQKDSRLYDLVAPLTSEELRGFLGYKSYQRLTRAAEKEALPLNTFCLRTLRHRTGSIAAEPGGTYVGHLFLDPIQATFKGGQTEPLHAWYPLLEGYSPGFVEEIIKNFAPRARRVLDPFSGTGTTPLTVATLGREAFYCELNPLLQFLTEAKLKAINLKEGARSRAVERLRAIAPGLQESIANSDPDRALASAYPSVFGESQFFDDRTYDLVLRTRTYIDSLACTNPLLADLLTVAVVSSLIPTSKLTRAGDVRFKTPEELAKEQVEFIPYLKGRILRIGEDLSHLKATQTRPMLVCEDARKLAVLPSLEIDTVITSPPYLNGTNYFRNTKVELWFLRCLLTARDLASFRHRAVTAGINDVTRDKDGLESDKDVTQVVARLRKGAYDQRIPKMVEAYFWDLSTVFAGLRRHLLPGAVVAVDIGDSAYGGVRVPTDQLLVSLLKRQGYKLQDEIQLRRRLSRSGTPLHQVLLVFSHSSRMRVRRPDAGIQRNGWYYPWKQFKQALPHQKRPYSKRNWGHPLHSLCSYQGKMKPSLASHLVRAFLHKPSVVLDPFAGVGTIPFEAALAGHKAYGFEISPAARFIAAAKLGRADSQTSEHIVSELEGFLTSNNPTPQERESAAQVGFNGKIVEYYHERTLREVLLARRFFLEKPPASASECLVMAGLLHILHGNRPYALSRRSHPITPFAPTGAFEYRPLVPRLREKVERTLLTERPGSFVEGRMFHQDATSWWPQEVDQLDAVITSPPFFDSTRFHLANWLRLWFCGWEAADFQAKPMAFVDERQKTSFSVYEPVFRQARERLKPGGIVVLHLGKSTKCDMGRELAKVATPWFRVADCFSEAVTHCESHGIRDKGTVVEHQYLLLS
jgi:DNA modification methylase